jgi:DNA-directed RNA polymerase alpha subunit
MSKEDLSDFRNYLKESAKEINLKYKKLTLSLLLSRKFNIN